MWRFRTKSHKTNLWFQKTFMILSQWLWSLGAPVLIQIYYIGKIDPGYSLKMSSRFGTSQVNNFSFGDFLFYFIFWWTGYLSFMRIKQGFLQIRLFCVCSSFVRAIHFWFSFVVVFVLFEWTNLLVWLNFLTIFLHDWFREMISPVP